MKRIAPAHGFRAALIACLLPLLGGCSHVGTRQLRENVRRAEAEMKRLEYVNHRHEELRLVHVRLTDAILAAAASRGVEPQLPPSSLGDLSVPVEPCPPGVEPRSAIEFVNELDRLSRCIQIGVNRERRLPQLEREVAELELRMESIEALPAPKGE